MRRILAPLGAFGAAVLIGVAAPGAASAAVGALLLNGETHHNPSGCYASASWPLSVANYTDEPVLVFDQPACEGSLIAVVNPDESATEEFGASVYIR